MTAEELLSYLKPDYKNYEVIIRNPYQPDIEMLVSNVLVSDKRKQVIIEYE